MLESQTAFAQRCNVTRQTVGAWLRCRRIDGAAVVRRGRKILINAEVAVAQLRARRDIGQVLGNGAKTRLSPPKPKAETEEHDGLNLYQPMLNYDDAAERGMAVMGLAIIHAVGACIALQALDAGAEMKVAYRLWQTAPLAVMELFEMHLGDFGASPKGMLYRPDLFWTVDWAMIAAERGEEVDMPTWEAWAKAHGDRAQ